MTQSPLPWRLDLAGGYDEGMKQNPRESPPLTKALYAAVIMLGVICCLVIYYFIVLSRVG